MWEGSGNYIGEFYFARRTSQPGRKGGAGDASVCARLSHLHGASQKRWESPARALVGHARVGSRGEVGEWALLQFGGAAIGPRGVTVPTASAWSGIHNTRPKIRRNVGDTYVKGTFGEHRQVRIPLLGREAGGGGFVWGARQSLGQLALGFTAQSTRPVGTCKSWYQPGATGGPFYEKGM